MFMPYICFALELLAGVFLLLQNNQGGVSLVIAIVMLTAVVLILVYCSGEIFSEGKYHTRSSTVASLVLTRIHVAVKFFPISTTGDCGEMLTSVLNSVDKELYYVLKHWDFTICFTLSS